ncbi:membrane-associated progesterone receptor component 1-like [Artemia franciscana]|uniref:Cytochrome b5 heme-binding domain-containing protein n=1 Tax=Artemia franciscana TaxID=6661 RepID=A0AA88HST2_ARTSF|nr:hypothetical protein QYM36_009951 [Artemia franciscana]
MDFMKELFSEIIYSPVNMVLMAGIVYLSYKIYGQAVSPMNPPPKPQLPPLEKQDMTIRQLKEYDGTKNDGRILVAVNGSIFDVTPKKNLYGPGGSYSPFAGRDASRALALFDVTVVKDEYDDLTDLTESQMSHVREWQDQFAEKYDYIGRLLKDEEKPDADAQDGEIDNTLEKQG